MSKNTKETLFWIFMAACLINFLLTFPGCKTVYRDIHHYDTTYLSKTKYDSLYFYDSIFVKEKGDTVFIDKTHFKTIYRDLIDTVYKYKVDTVKVPQIEEKVVVTNELKTWQKILCWIGVVSLLSIAIYLFCRLKI